MKRIYTIGLALVLAIGAFAQVNLWRRNGYLRQFDKATLDSITLTIANPYDEYSHNPYNIPYWEFNGASAQTIYDYQKALYVGLKSMNYSRHNDFGFAAVCMLLDSRGQDFIGPNIGHNWFGVWGTPSSWRANNTMSTAGLADYLVWGTFYKAIGACNYVIATHTSGSEADKFEVAQAKAVRAFEYMQLAQAYQVAYSESSLSLPCVPLVTDTLCSYLIINQPVATVAKVYGQIKKDLDEAISGLQGFVRADKSAVNRAVAFGLRARYNLLTHNYDQAASDAEQALLLSGAEPLTIAQASVPGFASAEAPNVLWANIITESDDVVQTGIINWPSHMSSFYLDGYTSVGATRSITSALYNEIPATDVRKGWWLDENGESPLLDAEGYSELKDNISNKNPYVNVKFGTGDGTGSGTGAAAADWIVMRAEEMILIGAEALARSGKDGGAVLTQFMKIYRDPNYDINAHGLSVADEIWWQRRVELWGEGFAFGDLMRLHKGVTRTTSTNWPSAWNLDVPADDERFPLAIPEKDPEYKVLAVWQNGADDLYDSYYLRLNYVDSISLGEAKEINDVYFGYAQAWNGVKRIYHSDFSQPLQRKVRDTVMAAHPDTITIEFDRSHNIREALTVPLIIEADPVFAGTAFPTEVSFIGGTEYTRDIAYVDLQIVIKDIPVGTHQFTITIPEEFAQGTGAKSFTYEITVQEPDNWDKAETKTGVFVDDAVISSLFGIEAGVAWTVSYKEIAKEDGSIALRILNPYACTASGDPDVYGIYDGFPYNDPGDWDTSTDYNIDLLISADNQASFAESKFDLGVDWSYGMMHIYDYNNAVGTYVPGVSITFNQADKGLVFGMGDGDYDLARYSGFSFYLSYAAYLAGKYGTEAAPAKTVPVDKRVLNGKGLNATPFMVNE